jgi:dTDP-4-amino-4,6-dideoxygalactose transaminase
LKIAINVPFVGKDEISAVTNILKNGALTSAANHGGEYVQAFEKSASLFIKSKYVVAVNSGTAALQAALYALDIKKGDEVLIPSFTFVATANFGIPAPIEEITKIAKKHNLPIIEDSAQSLGSTYKGKHAGTFFDLGCWSMYPAKVMTSGEGGFIATNNKKLRDKLLMIRNHGMVHGYDTRIFGLNLRLPEISAAIATIQMKKLSGFLKTRQKNANLLSKLISDLDIILPHQRNYENVNWYLYTIATSKRDKILKKLNAKGIGAASYYPIPVHKTPFYQQKIKLPVTEWASSHVLSLPIHPKVTTKNIEFIAKTLRDILNE